MAATEAATQAVALALEARDRGAILAALERHPTAFLAAQLELEAAILESNVDRFMLLLDQPNVTMVSFPGDLYEYNPNSRHLREPQLLMLAECIDPSLHDAFFAYSCEAIRLHTVSFALWNKADITDAFAQPPWSTESTDRVYRRMFGGPKHAFVPAADWMSGWSEQVATYTNPLQFFGCLPDPKCVHDFIKISKHGIGLIHLGTPSPLDLARAFAKTPRAARPPWMHINSRMNALAICAYGDMELKYQWWSADIKCRISELVRIGYLLRYQRFDGSPAWTDIWYCVIQNALRSELAVGSIRKYLAVRA